MHVCFFISDVQVTLTVRSMGWKVVINFTECSVPHAGRILVFLEYYISNGHMKQVLTLFDAHAYLKIKNDNVVFSLGHSYTVIQINTFIHWTFICSYTNKHKK